MYVAQSFKDLLIRRGYPVKKVYLYGSVAQGAAHPQSDIDIAVVTEPFHLSRMREGGAILLASKDIDLRIETVTLHPEDFDRPFFALGEEIKRTGVEV